jgi:hypothetical protein
MTMPPDIGIIDTMIDFPHQDMKGMYKFITEQTHDAESKEDFEFPVEYMFKDVPDKKLQGIDGGGSSRVSSGSAARTAGGPRPSSGTPIGSSRRATRIRTPASTGSGRSAG